MLRPYHTLALLCLMLFTATLFGFDATSHAQDTGSAHKWPIRVETHGNTQTLAQPAATPAQDALFSLYLPIARKPTEVTPVQFASAVTSEGTLVNPQAAFDNGVTTIYASATVLGGQGSHYLVRWSFNGVPAPSLDQTGTIVDQTKVVTAGFCNSTGYGCSAELAPLPRITMVVQVFLDGALVSEGTAVIQ